MLGRISDPFIHSLQRKKNLIGHRPANVSAASESGAHLLSNQLMPGSSTSSRPSLGKDGTESLKDCISYLLLLSKTKQPFICSQLPKLGRFGQDRSSLLCLVLVKKPRLGLKGPGWLLAMSVVSAGEARRTGGWQASLFPHGLSSRLAGLPFGSSALQEG